MTEDIMEELKDLLGKMEEIDFYDPSIIENFANDAKTLIEKSEMKSFPDLSKRIDEQVKKAWEFKAEELFKKIKNIDLYSKESSMNFSNQIKNIISAGKTSWRNLSFEEKELP